MTEEIMMTGKRKSAIARAVLREGSGKIRINKIPLEIYKPELYRLKIEEPLILSGIRNNVDIEVNVKGGGIFAQAEATRTAIGKCIIEYTKNEELRRKLYEYDRATVKNDTRRKEPKKYGGRGARKRRQKSYR